MACQTGKSSCLVVLMSACFISLQVVNKTDIADAIGADLGVMKSDGLRVRDGGPMVFAQVQRAPVSNVLILVSIVVHSHTGHRHCLG